MKRLSAQFAKLQEVIRGGERGLNQRLLERKRYSSMLSERRDEIMWPNKNVVQIVRSKVVGL